LRFYNLAGKENGMVAVCRFGVEPEDQSLVAHSDKERLDWLAPKEKGCGVMDEKKFRVQTLV
jgi:hypothetical protein